MVPHTKWLLGCVCISGPNVLGWNVSVDVW